MAGTEEAFVRGVYAGFTDEEMLSDLEPMDLGILVGLVAQMIKRGPLTKDDIVKMIDIALLTERDCPLCAEARKGET